MAGNRASSSLALGTPFTGGGLYRPSRCCCIERCPGGEIGKRCGLRSRWSYILVSSSLTPGTGQAPSKEGAFSFFDVFNSGSAQIHLLVFCNRGSAFPSIRCTEYALLRLRKFLSNSLRINSGIAVFEGPLFLSITTSCWMPFTRISKSDANSTPSLTVVSSGRF